MSGGKPGLARREFLAGSVAAAAGAVLLGGQPARALRASTSTAVPVGVTIDLAAFPAGTTLAVAMAEWAKVTGTTPLATKVYLGYREYPTVLDGKMAWCAQHGATAVICYQPAYEPFSSSDATALAASLAALKKAGLQNACVVLWSEPQSGKRKPAMSATTFRDGCSFYSQAARSAGWPVYWNSMGHPRTWPAYCPGDAVDGYAVDDYASRENYSDIWSPRGIATMADQDGKKFGWFEMGASASHPVTSTQVTHYMKAATAYLASRKPGTTGPVIWYNGEGLNTIVPPTGNAGNAYMQSLYANLYHTLA